MEGQGLGREQLGAGGFTGFTGTMLIDWAYGLHRQCNV